MVAQGSGEIMVEHGVHAWDLAALVPIVEEAGGKLTAWDGKLDIEKPDVLATNGLMHDELRQDHSNPWPIEQGRMKPFPPYTIAVDRRLPGHVRLIDQTLLPTQVAYRDCRTVEEVWEAIRMLRVRGAPAIGVAAAMGVVVGMQAHTEPATLSLQRFGSRRLSAHEPADRRQPLLGDSTAWKSVEPLNRVTAAERP